MFHFNAIVFVIPISYVFRSCLLTRDKPLLVAFLLTLVTSVFKSYPTISDTSLWLPFLMMHSNWFKYATYLFYCSSAIFSCLILGPLMYNDWVYSGSGNANFFYAITLVWNLAQVILATDLVYGMLRREFERDYPGWRRMRLELLYVFQ